MTHGFDTSFLVAAEILGHAHHEASRLRLQALRSRGDDFAIAAQVLAEFVHVVTDGNRFSEPLSTDAALSRAEIWWTSGEVMQVLPTPATLQEFFKWMRHYGLGRKCILDTLLAATYKVAGIGSVLTLDARGFAVFDAFQVTTP